MREGGPGCSSPPWLDNVFSAVERGDRVFVPVVFPGSRISSYIRSMPPLAFGIHNEQYDCDMVIIRGL